MKTVKLVCPNCASPDFEPLPMDPNRCRCRHCMSYFAVTEARSIDAPRGAPGVTKGGAANAGMGVVAIAFGATMVVLMGAGAAMFLVRGKQRSQGSSYRYTPPPSKRVDVRPAQVTVAEVEPEQVPQAEVRAVRHAEQSGYEVWVGEVANVGDVPIDRPCVRAVLKDASGSTIADQRGYAMRAAVASGESAPFRITAKKSAYAKVDLELCDVRAVSPYSSAEQPAKVVEQKHQRGDFGQQAVIGTVQNEQATVLKFVKVVALGRDAQGVLVSVDEGYADVHELQPGKKSAFKVSVGIFATGTVARYDTYALGMPGR